MPSSRGPICIAAFKIVSCHTLRWWCGPQAEPNASHHNYSQILRVFPKNLLTIPAVLCDNRIIEQLPNRKNLWQHRTIPALRLKHRSGGYGTASALPKCSIRHPIEKLWSKVKSFLRKFKARTLDALPNAIQCAFQTVSPSDCSGWFHSCGYSPYF